MSNQQIGKVSLKHIGLFVVRIQFSYKVGEGEAQLSEESENIRIGKTMILNPSELGVPEDATIQLIAIVDGDHNVRGSQTFHYKEENGKVANYHISGFLKRNKLNLVDVAVPNWENWSKNIDHDFDNTSNPYFTPYNRSELEEVLVQAQNQGINTVRVSGQRHSMPELVTEDNRSDPEGDQGSWIVDMSCYKDLGDKGDQSMLLSGNHVTVNAGVREDTLAAFLTANNKMLKTVTAGGFFSLGGMTLVDVHGSTIAEPIFSETASAFNIMGPNGEITTINATTPGEGAYKAIQFARVSFGMLGVVTSVVIDVKDRDYANTLVPGMETFELKMNNESDFISKFIELTSEHDALEVFFHPYGNILNPNKHQFLTLWWDIDENPENPLPNLVDTPPTACELADEEEFGAPDGGAFNDFAETMGLAAQDSGSSLLASSVVNGFFSSTEKMFHEAVQNYTDLWMTSLPRVIATSYFLELPDLDATGFGRLYQAIQVILNRLATSQDFMLASPLDIRFVKGGDTVLASSYSTISGSTFVNLDLLTFAPDTSSTEYPDNLKQFLADIEREWISMGARPHNGKMFGFFDPEGAPGSFTPPYNDGYLQAMYQLRQERVDAFKLFRSSRDPDGLFTNPYVDKLLGNT